MWASICNLKTENYDIFSSNLKEKSNWNWKLPIKCQKYIEKPSSCFLVTLLILFVKAANQSCKTRRTSLKTNRKTYFVNQTINHRKNNFLLKMKFIDPFLWNAASNLNRTVLFFAAIIFADQRGSCVSDDKVLCRWVVNDNILWDFCGRASNFLRQIGHRNKILLGFLCCIWVPYLKFCIRVPADIAFALLWQSEAVTLASWNTLKQ